MATRRERSAHHRRCDPALPLALQSDPDQRRREHRTRASFARLPDFPDRIQSLSTRSEFYLRDPDVDLPARYHRRPHHLHLDRTSGYEFWVRKTDQREVARISCSTSSREDGFSRKMPRIDDVTVLVPGFLIPRIDMQRCSASTTTAAPRGLSF